MNLLSKQIIEMKRELTALKTAHKRGIGTLRVYQLDHYFSEDGIAAGEQYNGTLTVNFSPDFAPYPFVYLLPMNSGNQPWNMLTNSVDVLAVRFINGGTTAIFDCNIFYGPFGPDDIYNRIAIYSTAPIISAEGDWTLYG